MLDDKVFEERVRLLLLDNPRRAVATEGSLWPKKWPSYIASAVWWAFFFTAIAALLVLLCMITFAKYEEDTMLKRPIYLTRFVETPLVQAERSEKIHKDSILSSMLESSSNAFFVTGAMLDWRSSCSLESLLRQANDKNVFLVTFVQGAKNGRYEKRLRSEYSNLMMLKADGEQFFKGSMFEGDWRGAADSKRDAELLTIWQFGGTAMADDVVITTKLPKSRGDNCLVSPDFISCPSQCSAFLYQLILGAKENPGAAMKLLVDSSIKAFCGNPAACPGVQKLQATCSQPGDGCFLFKVPQDLTPSNKTWSVLGHHCPVTYSTFQADSKSASVVIHQQTDSSFQI